MGMSVLILHTRYFRSLIHLIEEMIVGGWETGYPYR